MRIRFGRDPSVCGCDKTSVSENKRLSHRYLIFTSGFDFDHFIGVRCNSVSPYEISSKSDHCGQSYDVICRPVVQDVGHGVANLLPVC